MSGHYAEIAFTDDVRARFTLEELAVRMGTDSSEEDQDSCP
jgi:hypothetical protein